MIRFEADRFSERGGWQYEEKLHCPAKGARHPWNLGEENARVEKDFGGCREHCGARCFSLLGHFPLGMM